MKKSNGIAVTVLVICSIAIAIVFLVPLLWMVSTSFKPDDQAVQAQIHWIPQTFTWANYVYSLFQNSTDVPVLKWFVNSMVVSVAGTLLVLVVDSLAAYALARLDVPGKKYFFAVFIGTLMVPWIIIFVPLYLEFSSANLLNTYAALILPYSANAFGVFFLRQFFLGFPHELEEAAQIDGGGKWTIFARVVLPLAKPALSTLAIFTFIQIYNDFMWPLVITSSPDMRTLTVGVAVMQQGAYTASYGKLMALTTMATLPMLLVFAIGQKYFIKGVAFTGIK
jgi:multiple sugar transport system permease protein